MRALFILILLSALGNTSLTAQPFHAGLLAGISATQVDGDTYAGYDKAGLMGGVFVNTQLNDWLYAQFEIKYTGKGAKKPVSSNDPEIYTLALHYIDMPLLAGAKIKKIASVEIGLMPAYLFSANGETSLGKFSNKDMVSFKKFDFLFLTGVNIQLLEKLTFNFRYSYSLASILKIDNPDTLGTYYNWFGRLFGRKVGEFNNCLTMGVYYQLK
jgi:opacity protein-like surface antigen